jgi:AcrR family transcriptional regulator
MIPNRKEKERGQRRESLLEAAARVFGRKPFDEASMQEVAAEAQIGMQGLYEHFPSKQVLYEQVVVQRALAYQAQAELILLLPGSPMERVRKLATVFVQQFKDQPWRLPVFIRDRMYLDWGLDSRFSPQLREIYEGERAHLKGLLVRAVEAGELRALDAEFLTQLFMDVFQASLHYSHHSQSEEEVEACVERALDCLLHGVGGRP